MSQRLQLKDRARYPWRYLRLVNYFTPFAQAHHTRVREGRTPCADLFAVMRHPTTMRA